MGSRWSPGEVVVRREVLGLAPVAQAADPAPGWVGRPWMAMPVYVVEDSADALVTYVAPGAQFEFPDGEWPTPDRRHPWWGRGAWTGHGTLMVQRPGDHHAVWHFWSGPRREFTCWYINLQVDAVRTAVGYDTQDLELDIVVLPDGSWTVKDQELLERRVAEGRFSPAMVTWIESLGDELVGELAAGRRWWDGRWAHWEPDAGWRGPSLPPGWDAEEP